MKKTRISKNAVFDFCLFLTPNWSEKNENYQKRCFLFCFFSSHLDRPYYRLPERNFEFSSSHISATRIDSNVISNFFDSEHIIRPSRIGYIWTKGSSTRLLQAHCPPWCWNKWNAMATAETYILQDLTIKQVCLQKIKAFTSSTSCHQICSSRRYLSLQ